MIIYNNVMTRAKSKITFCLEIHVYKFRIPDVIFILNWNIGESIYYFMFKLLTIYFLWTRSFEKYVVHIYMYILINKVVTFHNIHSNEFDYIWESVIRFKNCPFNVIHNVVILNILSYKSNDLFFLFCLSWP